MQTATGGSGIFVSVFECFIDSKPARCETDESMDLTVSAYGMERDLEVRGSEVSAATANT